MTRVTRITSKEEAFAQEICAGKLPLHAFLAAGYKASNSRIGSIAAQRCLNRQRVSDRIQQLRDRAARPAVLTRQRKLERLAAMVEEQIGEGSQLTSEQLKAVEIDAKMQGHNEPEKLKVEGLGSVLQRIRKTAPKP